MEDMNVNVDLILNGQAQGDVAGMILNNKLNPGAMRPFIHTDGKCYISVFKGGDAKIDSNYQVIPIMNATLRRDEWIRLDEAVINIGEDRLTGVNDLISKGLTYELGNGMGTTVLEWHDVSDGLEADMTMDAVARAKNDRPAFSTKYLPIPIIHADYQINERVLQVSRNMGNGIDTTLAERAARKVAEKLENLLFASTTSFAFGGGNIYSYTNYPDRNLLSYSNVPGAHWNDSGTTGADIVKQVQAMKQEMIDNFQYGPYMIYIPTNFETCIDNDYDATSGVTIRERILKIENIQGIKVVDKLASDNVLMVQMKKETVRLVRGMGIQNVQWDTEGKFVHNFKVLTIQVPQIRSDQNGKCGIVHLS